MINGIALVVKKPGMPDDEFHRYWREVHGPIALQMKNLRRYVQSHRLPQPLPGFEQVPYDGIAEVWFDTLDEIVASGKVPAQRLLDAYHGEWNGDISRVYEQSF